MRVSTDPKDPAYVDERPRRVWCNDVEILGWTVADEFRRCVVTPERVHNGAVRIERLPAAGDAPAASGEGAQAPIHAGFSGVLVSVPDAKPAAPVEPAAAPAVPAPKKTAKRRRR